MTSGLRCTSAGVPSAILRPKSSTTTLSEIGITSPMWCSTSRTVTWYCARMVLMSVPSTPTSSWLRPPAGSSTSRSRGCPASARASSTRLSVPNGRPAAGLPRHLVELEEVEQRHRLVAYGTLLAVHPRHSQRVAEKVAARLAVQAGHHVLQHGQRGKQGEVLERAAHPELGDAVRRTRQDRAAGEQHVAPVGRVETRQAVEQRRLAGAVGTDERHDLALGDVEPDTVKRDDAAEADREIADGQDRITGGVTGCLLIRAEKRRCQRDHGF
jgi:hypothetical protein